MPISFLLRNPGVNGGLYLIRNGFPLVSRPSLRVDVRSMEVLFASSLLRMYPLNLMTASLLCGTGSILMRGSSGSGSVVRS